MHTRHTSYISCIKFAIIINKTRFKEISPFQVPHPCMELLFHATVGLTSWSCYLYACNSYIFPYWQPLVLCSTAFELWWLSLVPCWIIFPTPIHMIHSDLGCENHTISKMMAKHTTKFWSETRTSATLGFLPVEKSNENSLQNPLEH